MGHKGVVHRCKKHLQCTKGGHSTSNTETPSKLAFSFMAEHFLFKVLLETFLLSHALISRPPLPRCRGTASRTWRRPWSCLASSSTTRCSCSPSSARWKCSARSPWGTAATWPHLSWRRCKGDWSTPPTSSNTCCRTSSTATWRARTTPSCCCAGKTQHTARQMWLKNVVQVIF